VTESRYQLAHELADQLEAYEGPLSDAERDMIPLLRAMPAGQIIRVVNQGKTDAKIGLSTPGGTN
jgi:hypothetical protein